MEGTKGRAKGEEAEGGTEREERLTRRDQRRDSCLRRVSLRGQEGPREKEEKEEEEEERNILAGRDICGGGIHAFARNKETRSKKIKAVDGPSSFFSLSSLPFIVSFSFYFSFSQSKRPLDNELIKDYWLNELIKKTIIINSFLSRKLFLVYQMLEVYYLFRFVDRGVNHYLKNVQ